ncbi:MAG: ABC transporter ATP-binding protein [Gammaproteobacteria bacterium]
MNALEITNLQKTYKNGVTALRGIDLCIAENDFFALLGPNGAGKSTIIGIVSSLVAKSAGKVKIFGTDLDTDLNRAKSYLGIVPQELNFSQFESPAEILINQAGFYGIPRSTARPRAEKLLKQLGLWDKRDGISRNLSGGMKRRLMIARALLHEPRLLLLDEPTAGVDVELRRTTWDFLRKINNQGTTILLTTHYLEEAEQLCKDIAIIDNGKIILNSSMKNVLAELHAETFVLDLTSPLSQLPALPTFALNLVDPRTLEVELDQHQNLNDLYQALSEQGITISSMRNKSNRLEELFIKLLGSGAAT